MGGRSGRNAKSPAFQFYPGDFVSDPYVLAMSMEQRGIYVTLLCCAWTDGSIPSDPAILAPLCKTEPKRFARVWTLVSTRFCPHEADPLRLVNPRMERERAFQAESKARRLAASKAANEAQHGTQSGPNRNSNGADYPPVDPLTLIPIPEALLEDQTRVAREVLHNGPEPEPVKPVRTRKQKAAIEERWDQHENAQRRQQSRQARKFPGVDRALAIMAREQEQPAEPAKRPA